jgi:hypothetical protein
MIGYASSKLQNDRVKAAALFVAYALFLLAAYLPQTWLGDELHLLFSLGSHIHESIPAVSRKNVSAVTELRYKALTADFAKALNDDSWKLLRKGVNVSIEILSQGEIPYIRTVTVFKEPPEAIRDRFRLDKLVETQRTLDPFFEDINVLQSISPLVGKGLNVIQKTSKRPLIFPKRIFELAHIERKVETTFEVNFPVDKQIIEELRSSPKQKKFQVTKGTSLHSLISLDLPADFVGASKDLKVKSNYVKAYQDFVAYYIPKSGGGTILLVVMKVSLGADIPRWAFLTTIAATGVWAMQALQNLIDKKSIKQPKSVM